MDELGGDLGVGRLEHAPLADARAHMLLSTSSVDLGGDPADRLAVALGQEEAGLGMLEPGIGARIDAGRGPRS